MIYIIIYIYNNIYIYERYILPVLLVVELPFHLAGVLLKSRREVCVFFKPGWRDAY